MGNYYSKAQRVLYRLIDRDRLEGASPHTLTMEDWDMIEKSPYLWARKFDKKRDSEVIEKVYETWKPKMNFLKESE